MQRYKMAIKAFDRVVQIEIEDLSINAIEHFDGEWVRYEDVKLMIETKPSEITIESESDIKAEIRKLRHGVNSLQQTIRIACAFESVILESERVECNCAEKSNSTLGSVGGGEIPNHWAFHSWICPAHGYKRL